MQGIVQEDPEMSFRRGYEQGAIETFHLRAWIEKDVYVWGTNSILSYPPIWQLGLVADSRSASLAE